MSNRTLAQIIKKKIREVAKLAHSMIKSLVFWVLRGGLAIARQPTLSNSGFILPTTVLLLLVVTLTVGAITLRTYNRTAQTVGERQERVIYNAATPTIDRAKSKLEYLFNSQRDPRYPGGIPAETVLYGMLINDGQPHNGITVQRHTIENNIDPYTFPREERIDIDNDGQLDNAWKYPIDTDEDGENDATVAYSILFQTPANPADMKKADDTSVSNRARVLQVRHGPLSNTTQLNTICQLQNSAAAPVEQGWFQDEANTSVLRKNFQVNAFVLPENRNGTVSALEFHQDRQVNRGNKWGAWFRNDLEIFPGPQFNWNGAMHTEGNLIVGNGSFTAYLISSPASCLYTREASEITVSDVIADPENDVPAFQGQILSGKTGNNSFDNGDVSRFHIHASPPITNGDDNVKLARDSDSVGGNNPKPADYALDPIKLLTEDKSVARSVVNPSANRAGNWSARKMVTDGRIFNRSEQAPYVDDTFRADNRFGPKPRYKGIPIPVPIGTEIAGNQMNGGDNPISDEELTRNAPPTGGENVNVGLDGYWERRARAEGLRLIVGQRLELGNYVGWNGLSASGASLYPTNPPFNTTDPLLPWSGNCTTNNSNRCHEARQRRTLRDNLAAVQATAVYHAAYSGAAAGDESRDFPIACLATTVHPGTATTLERSSTFENLLAAGEGGLNTTNFPIVVSDFFTGRGTNGWEYTPPAASPSDFKDKIAATATLGMALRNLAYFAGDPKGGAPTFEPQQDGTVHSYPWMSMWGDFSTLRLVLNKLDSGTDYYALSPADKTTLHTAACTLGMLAYNLGTVGGYNYAPPNNQLNEVGLRIKQMAGTQPGGPADLPSVPASSDAQAFVRAFEQWRDNGPTGQREARNKLVSIARLVITKEQIERDRVFGFRNGKSPNCQNNFAGVNGASGGATGHLDGLRFLCGASPKFPILYSLFPGNTNGDAAGNVDSSDDHAEKVPDSRGSFNTYIASVNPGATRYKAIDINNLAVLETIAVKPRLFADWKLPFEAAGNGTTPNKYDDVLIKECITMSVNKCVDPVAGAIPSAKLVRIPFKDAAFMNGREMMPVRTLDLQLDLMHRSTNNLTGGNHWLPNSGLVYAFREDAVREDAIVRSPGSGANWATCGNDAGIQTVAACRMNAVGDALSSTDPPVSETRKISPKPVDYYADPDRRPYGFRLRNGKRLDRAGDEGRGLSFISDNPVYIMGDFNLHQTYACNDNPNCRLEEFRTLLNIDNFSNFYSRNNLDERFARPATDRWRPSEILADAVTILSSDFCDGSIADGFETFNQGNSATLDTALMARYGCGSSSDRRTSFLNQNRPNPNNANSTLPLISTVRGSGNADKDRWHHENPYDEGSPIAVTRNGNPLKADGTEYASSNDRYREFSDGNKPLIGTDTNRVNAIIISGLVPSRPNQAYGGLHNFPRFIENWDTLIISGSFLQLNFSNYATGPFSQNAWESAVSNPMPAGGEQIKYYTPPNRRWGYDVGLQYAPAGPIAQRFVTAEAIRSEFYSEPPADDQYIINLCRAIADDPDARCAD
ncbi:MAG: hormogonium polysaccharide biosynthesis protein HpsA [Elainellaceae cyanobacterium]